MQERTKNLSGRHSDVYLPATARQAVRQATTTFSTAVCVCVLNVQWGELLRRIRAFYAGLGKGQHGLRQRLRDYHKTRQLGPHKEEKDKQKLKFFRDRQAHLVCRWVFSCFWQYETTRGDGKKTRRLQDKHPTSALTPNMLLPCADGVWRRPVKTRK